MRGFLSGIALYLVYLVFPADMVVYVVTPCELCVVGTKGLWFVVLVRM